MAYRWMNSDSGKRAISVTQSCPPGLRTRYASCTTSRVAAGGSSCATKERTTKFCEASANGSEAASARA